VGTVDVVGGQVSERAAALVFVVERDTPGGKVGWQRQGAWIEVFSSAEITYSSPPNGLPSKTRA